MSDTQYDLVVIGSGPGGYVGAIKAAQLGLKVAIVEKDSTLGGTCLNVGCIPSKALLEASEHYHVAQHGLSEFGVEVSGVKLNLINMMRRKAKVVSELTSGIAYLMDKNKITNINGYGRLKSNTEVEILTDGKVTQTLNTKNIMLATGSVPNELPFLKYNGKNIVSSTEALSLPTVPKKMVVVGAGVIGLELGSVWSRLGSEVTVIEYGSKICGAMDKELSKKLQTSLKKQGLNFIFDAKVTGAQLVGKSTAVTYESLKDGKENTLDCEIVLVATGRRPFSDGLGLENLGIETNKQGFVTVDDHFRTQHSNIYAIGDLIPGPMLAHKAEEEGVAVAEIIVGQAGHVNYETVPSVVYTHPEAASVGATEEELKAAGVPYLSGKFPFTANGRAKASNKTEGFVKILAHKETDRVLGVHILAAGAGELLGECIVAMEFSASSEDIARSFHSHPTMSEVIREAALNVSKSARQM